MGHELLDAIEVERRYPALHLQRDEVAMFEPRAGILRPEACVAAHARLACAAGGEAHYSEAVRAWTANDGGAEIVTDTGRYSARQVVFTCGGWLSQVLGDKHVWLPAS